LTQIIQDIVTWLKQWYYTEDEVDDLLELKQDVLESGTNIKTVNNTSLLGSGNINISGGSGGSALACVSDFDVDTDVGDMEIFIDACDSVVIDSTTGWSSTLSDTKVPSEKLVKETIDTKQATLVSGTNIKTVNNESLLGSGNITIQGGSGSVIGTGSFSINGSGHLIVELPNAVDCPYYIDSNGHLYYDTSNTHNGGLIT